jgi:ribosome-binding protein aMBF1 (putative translation factor)
MYYLYKHNTEYRKAVDDYREASRQSKMTLADRLKEMKEHALKIEKERRIDR